VPGRTKYVSGPTPALLNHAPTPGGERGTNMKARNHTAWMLQWWNKVGINRVDLAVRRSCGAMIWHYNTLINSLTSLLQWAKAENVRHADVYARPARGYPWPLVFLDDVSPYLAARVVQRYDALVIKTSVPGGCHLWLSCSQTLDEEARGRAQRWLAHRSGADLASTSGEHLGRLAGFRNWKRGGTWVNVIDSVLSSVRPWVPGPEEMVRRRRPVLSSDGARHATRTDSSDSGREWGWVCGLLEAGYRPRDAYLRLIERARPRRGRDVERYARRTIKRALEHVQQASRSRLSWAR
jgi:hypothetical protein